MNNENKKKENENALNVNKGSFVWFFFFFFFVRFCSSNRLRVPELSTYPTVRTSAPIRITMTSAAWVIPELHPSPTSIVPHPRPASTPPVKTPENFS